MSDTETSAPALPVPALPAPALPALDAEVHLSLRDHVHRSLRMAIVSGTLTKGMRLNERRLAEGLGVSTTPVKEALRQLEAEGLIAVLPRRGHVVRYDRAFAEEMILARAALESVIAALAARRIDAARKRTLTALIARMGAAVETSSASRFVALNEAFHNEIHAASRAVHINRLVDQQQFYDRSARRVIHGDPADRNTAFHEHTVIAAAIQRGDEAAAAEAMQRHVLRSGERYLAIAFGETPHSGAAVADE